jgi:RNA polymerase sigma factor (sigma-70 family)
MGPHPAALVDYLRRFALTVPVDEASDAALLGRFISTQDQRAFAALVERHGPLVFQVCHRAVGDLHETEDAFQAVFLVLARKAATVRPREALPAWLHGVARRVAMKARSRRARRSREVHVADGCPADEPGDPNLDPPADVASRENLVILDEELDRLADVHRLPVVLCCLEGHSVEEAARSLGWTPGSVKGRLERGRVRLRDQLARRGLALPAVLSAVAATRGAAIAATSRLGSAAVAGALAFGMRAGGAASTTAALLAADTLRDMALGRLRSALTVLLAVGALTTGILVYRANGRGPDNAPEPPAVPQVLKAQADERLRPINPAFKKQLSPVDLEAPVAVTGQVLDPDGKPCPGAKVYLGYSVRSFTRSFDVRKPPYAVRAVADADGQFQFSYTRAELNARWLDDSAATIAAVAEGHGTNWVEIPMPASSAELSLQLARPVTVQGRIVDERRSPVAGARIVVIDVTRDRPEETGRRLAGNLNHNPWSASSWRGPFPEQSDIVTDGDGRFRIPGVAADHVVRVAVEQPGLSELAFDVIARTLNGPPATIYGAEFEHVAPAARPIRGVVRDQATGKPLPGVKISAQWHRSTALTAEDGSYQLSGCGRAQEYFLLAQPAAGQPYFMATMKVADKEAPWLTADFELRGGIVVQGRLTDNATGKPPATASVWYHPLRPNPHAATLDLGGRAAASSAIQPDGSFNLVVLPGPGAVCALGSPRAGYAAAVLDKWEVGTLLPGGLEQTEDGHLYLAGPSSKMQLCVDNYHVVKLINPDQAKPPPPTELALTSSVPLRGTVFGPDGEPLTGVRVIGAGPLGDEFLPTASFTVTRLRPDEIRDVIFQHPSKPLGKLLTVKSGDAEPLLVQLDSSASIYGHVVDARGLAMPDLSVFLQPEGGGAPVPTRTDSDGGFRASVPAGKSYGIEVQGPRARIRRAHPTPTQPGRSVRVGVLVVND